MTFCEICNKNFANKASLRTHRSKFHRDDEFDISNKPDTESDDNISGSSSEHNDDPIKEESVGKGNIDAEAATEISNSDTDGKKGDLDALQTDNETNKRKHNMLHTDHEVQPKKRKGKTEKRGYNPYPPKNNNHHVYKKLSILHDILKTHLGDSRKTYGFSDCYTLKHHVYDKLIPNIFEDEESMQNALSEEEFYMAQMIRNLKKLSDIYAVLNEEKYLDTFSRIGDIYLKSVEK